MSDVQHNMKGANHARKDEKRIDVIYFILAGLIMAGFIANGSLHQLILGGAFSGGERFKYHSVLLFCENIAQIVVSLPTIARARAAIRHLPYAHMILISLFNSLSSYLTTQAFERNLPYPVVLVAKSAKTISLMLVMAVVIPLLRLLPERIRPPIATKNTHITVQRWVAAATLAIGMVLFTGLKTSHSGDNDPTAYVFLLLSTISGGLQSIVTDDCMLRITGISSSVVGAVSALSSVAYLAVVCTRNHQIADTIATVRQYPMLGLAIVAFALAFAIGSTALFAFIKRYGGVQVSVITTLRKCCSILLSVFIQGDHLTAAQVTGLVIVLFSIFSLVDFRSLKKE